MSHRFYSLYMSVKVEVTSALRSARLGEKDRARERLRFIQNSRLIDILREHDFAPGFPVNVRLLEWEFLQAMNECCPDGASLDGNRDLFEAILSRLDLIAHHVACKRPEISVGVREVSTAAVTVDSFDGAPPSLADNFALTSPAVSRNQSMPALKVNKYGNRRNKTKT